MARKTPAPYMTLAAANFFLKYAKARGVSKVARGESSSKVTREGFMQAYARVKGDPKKLTTRMATPTQSWAERRDNFVGRHMAQMTLHGEKLWETAGKYKGQPTRRHLGLIMWAMTPDPNGVGRFIAKARGVKVPAARKNGLSKRRRSARASTGHGLRIPAAWVTALETVSGDLMFQLDGSPKSAFKKTFVPLDPDAPGVTPGLRVLLDAALESRRTPFGVELVVAQRRTLIPGHPTAGGIYSRGDERITLLYDAPRSVIQHELIHFMQDVGAAGELRLELKKPAPPVPAVTGRPKPIPPEFTGVGQEAGYQRVGMRRAYWDIATEIGGTVDIVTRGGKQGVLVTGRRPSPKAKAPVYTRFYPFPVTPMPPGTVKVRVGDKVGPRQTLFTLPGAPRWSEAPTPIEFEAYLGPLATEMEDAIAAEYGVMDYQARALGRLPDAEERVEVANTRVHQLLNSLLYQFKDDKRAFRDASKRLADAGAREVARMEATVGARIDAMARKAGIKPRRYIGTRMAAAAARTNSRTTTAKRDDPDLWEEVKAEVTRGTKGGKAGQWSARKAQMAVALYQQRGGGYIGPKSPRNALAKWTREEWGTRSGKASLVTGERYLPRAAREALTPAEYAETTRAKRAGLRRGEQFTPQPGRIAKKTARYRRK
jgi:hypothetical protein